VTRWFLAISAAAALLIAVASAYGLSVVIIDRNVGTDSGGFDRAATGVSQASVDEAIGPCVNDVCNYLLLGSDSREGLTKAQLVASGTNAQAGAGTNADVIMLVHTDPALQKAIIVSFPRDLWVGIPGHGYGRINSAFGLGGGAVDGGGPQLIARTIHSLTGLKTNHYLYVDLKGFEGVVQALGGVDMCIPAENVDTPGSLIQMTATGSHQVYNGEQGHVVDLNTGLDVLPGCQRLDAQQALGYVRSRHLPCDTFADLNRIGRQQQFLHAVMNRLLQPSELLHAVTLVGPVLHSLQRDQRLSLADMVHLVGEIKGIGTGSVDFRTVPTAGFTTPAGQSVLRMLPSAKALFRSIDLGRPLGPTGITTGYTPPSPADITVPVIDHRSNGKAQGVWQVLAQSGFNISSSPVSPSAYSKGEPGNFIAYAPGHDVEAKVVQQYLPGLPLQQVAGLPDHVAVYVSSSYQPSQIGSGNTGATAGTCVTASG